MIMRCRPIIHAENSETKPSPALIDFFYELNYTPHWELSYAFDPMFRGKFEDITDGYYSVNVICVPQEKLHSEGIIMLGYVVVERDKPLLVDYSVSVGSTVGQFTQGSSLS